MKVYERARQDAEAQIQIRLDVLALWEKEGIPWKKGVQGDFLRDAEGELLLDFFPTTQQGFSKWTAESHSAGNRTLGLMVRSDGVEKTISLTQLEAISRTTLNQPYHSRLKVKVIAQMTAVASRARLQLEQTRKSSIIAQLNAEISHLRNVVDAQESEARDGRVEARIARSKLKEVTEQANRDKAELQRINSQLELRIAELVKEFSKLASLKVAKK